MSTSYYAIRAARVCGECKRPYKDHRTLIGVSSIGWRFLFQEYEELTTAREWLDELAKPGVAIEDGYGAQKTLQQFKVLLRSKQDDASHLEPVNSSYRVDSLGFEFSRRLA